MSGQVFIYALIDPRSGDICYVGKTGYPDKRLDQHIRASKKQYLHQWHRSCKRWIAELVESGARPEMRILEACEQDQWEERERYWIAHGRAEGWPLVNVAPGGAEPRQPPGFSLSLEARAKISAANKGQTSPNKGRSMSDAQKDKLRQASTGRLHTPEERAKQSAAQRGRPSPHKGHPMSSENRTKLAAANAGRKRSPEVVEKSAAKQRGRKQPPEHVEKVRQALMGHETSEETRRKISDKLKGRVFSDETRAKMAASARLRHQRVSDQAEQID